MTPHSLTSSAVNGNVGDVDDQNHYWMINHVDSRWWEIDLKTLTVIDAGVAPTGTQAAADWVFLPGTNKLWRIDFNVAATRSYLRGFDRTTHQWTARVDLGPISDNRTGAAFGDSNGNLYASYNNTGRIYRINVNTHKVDVLTLNGPVSSNNDGARCADAPLPIDFGDAPASYGTTLDDTGAGHSVIGYGQESNTAALMLGTSIDIENDGAPSEDADGDDKASVDDEDGVGGPVVISAGKPEVVISATNKSSEAANLSGWIDLNGDGKFSTDERATVSVPPNSGTDQYTLSFSERASAAENVYARFRIMPNSSVPESGGALPTGTVTGGEVEDYPVQVRQLTVDKTSSAGAGTHKGDSVTYTVTVANTGSGDYTAADPASMTDDLSDVLDDASYNNDAAVSFSDGSKSDAPSIDGDNLSWSGPLKAGEVATISYSVNLSKDGNRSVVNSACIPAGDAQHADDACTGTETDLPSLTIKKKADTTELPQVGQTVTYTVTATNDGPGDYTADDPAVVADDLTDVLDDATLDESTISADAGNAPTYSKPVITWTGPLASGDSATITYQVTYTGAGDSRLVNVAWQPTDPKDPKSPKCEQGDKNGVDPDTGEPCDRIVIPAADLHVVKTVDPKNGSAVTAGDKLDYTITFSNDGTAVADVDSWTDDLSAVLDDAEITNPVSSDNDLITSAISDGKFTIEGSVPAGKSYVVKYTATVKADGQRGDNLLGNFVIPPGGDDPDGTCVTGDPLCTENPVEQIDVVKSVDPQDGSTVQSGQVLTYTLTFTNSGQAAGQVHKVDDLAQLLDDTKITKEPVASDNALTVSTIKNAQFSIDGTLQPGQKVTVSYQATVNPTADLGDTVLANFVIEPGDEPPSGCDPGDPTCTENVTPKITDSKSVDPKDGTTVEPGRILTYTLTFRNDGTAPGDVNKVDDLTQVLDDATISKAPVTSSDALSVSKIADGRFAVTGTLQPEQKATVSYQVTVKDADQLGDGDVTNYLLNPGDTPSDEGDGCKSGDPKCTDNPVPHIVSAKSVDPESGTAVDPGQVLTYNLTFTNKGAGTGAVNKVDDLTYVLDDAKITKTPQASDDALSVSKIKGNQFSITGDLAAGQSITVSYQATVRQADDLGDKVLGNFLINPGETPPDDPENFCQSGSQDCTVNPVPDLIQTKSVSPKDGSTVQPGQKLTYTLTFTNTGAAAAQVNKADDLTQVLDDATVTSDPTATDPSLHVSSIKDNRYKITGTVAPGKTVTVSYQVTVKDADQLGDTQLANFLLNPGEVPPKDPSDCEAGDTDCTYNVVPHITDHKSVDPETGASVEPGQTLSYTLTFSNDGKGAGKVDRVDDLTHVLDDATIAGEPKVSSTVLSVSHLKNKRYAITGTLKPGQP